MVLGLSSKNKKVALLYVDYLIHIHEIKPWPPSQSLRSLRSVLIQWQNGERNSGLTNSAVPTLGSVIGEGKIEFNESFKLSVNLSKDISVRTRDNDTFVKNVLEFNLYEPRREKTHQLLATGTIDLAHYGVVKESLSISAPMNSKRNYRNTVQPVLFLTLQPLDKRPPCSSSRRGGTLSKEISLGKNSGESVSALMDEECDEIASFTDDDVYSHSSLTVSSSTLASSGSCVRRNVEEERERDTNNAKGKDLDNAIDLSSDFGGPISVNISTANASSASSMSERETNTNMESNGHGDSVSEGHKDISSAKNQNTAAGKHKNGENSSKSSQFDTILDEADTNQYSDDDLIKLSSQAADRNQVLMGKVDRLKNVKSVRSTSDTARSNGGVSGDSGSFWSIERKDAKVYPKDTSNMILENKIKQLEGKIKMLEGELREAAAIEAALYSVVAEHGSSVSKVHAPARRLSRLYLYACRESPSSRRGTAAKSAVSGLVLAAKACGNDVPRLTYWFSNSVVLRTIISQINGGMQVKISAGDTQRQSSERETKKKLSPLQWKESSLSKKDHKSTISGRFGDWDDPNTYTSALEKVEAWIFSRIVESIWWQTLTPHMQSAAAKAFSEVTGSGSKKNLGRKSSSVDQVQGNFSLELWKKAFKDACERLCPLRAGGHECGCLPVLARLIMEQCVARLDVAIFNAILRDSSDEIPTDPVSDPIVDSKVLPIPAGKSSFGAGAQLKNAIGNWSRWLTDLFGIDDEDATDDEANLDDDERQNTSFKSFHLLNALSDLIMLPKDMLLNSSIRKEVCPTFGAPLIKRILCNFVPDEFCLDPIPHSVLEALESEESHEAEAESIRSYPCTAAPPIYSPPSASVIAGFIGEFGSQSQLGRSGSSVIRKSYTSDDELEELNSPLGLILIDTTRTSPIPTKSYWASKRNGGQSAVRYELLRDIWMNGE